MKSSFLVLFILISAQVFSKVDPPNYHFSLDKFKDFMPGQKLEDIQKKYSRKELVFKDTQFETYKFYITHTRYKFAIAVQFKNNIVTDFHARLPNYFLHDVFHQSLINRMGVQDLYKKVEEQAVYIWKNKNNKKHIYSGACSITCFPIYYAVKTVEHNFGGNYKAVIDKFLLSEGKHHK